MGWYVLETNPCVESAIQDRITKLGTPSLLLRMRRITRSHHARANPFIPLFPRYLFVQMDLPSDKPLIGIIKRYPGAKSWLGASAEREMPMAVRPNDIARLQEIADDLCKEVVLDNAPPKPLAKDTVVRVLWGAMSDVLGKIEFDNGIRADVLLMAAGVASKISLPRELIEAA